MTDLLNRHSFVELGARQRAKALLDAGSYRELIDPFQRVMSPWLSRQGVVPQAALGLQRELHLPEQIPATGDLG